ncbi:MAG TPA: DUF4870 domain-containing protein [Longimicrobiaceae bacterium]|nr:DUF4870 domain-containing protein [Longimicrobiaceae bacterium]
MSEHPVPAQSTGLAPNVAGALAYLLGPLTGVVFFLIEKESRFVRFHAAQSIVVGIAMVVASIVLSVLGAVLAVVPVIGWLIGLLLSMAFGFGSFVLWIVLMFKAFQGEEWEVPLVGAQAHRLLAAPAAR